MSGDREDKPIVAALEGSLAELDLRRFLADVFRDGASGILRIASGDRVTELCFEGGWISDALSSVPESELSSVLLRHAKVRPSQIKLAMDTLESGGDVGDRLVQLGYLSAMDLAWARQERISWIATDCMGWSEGDWRFFQEPPARPVAGYRVSPFEIVLRSYLRDADPAESLANLGGEDARPVVDRHGLLSLSVIDLPEEMDFLALSLDGSRSLGDAIHRSEVSAADALPFLQALSELEILKLEGMEGDSLGAEVSVPAISTAGTTKPSAALPENEDAAEPPAPVPPPQEAGTAPQGGEEVSGEPLPGEQDEATVPTTEGDGGSLSREDAHLGVGTVTFDADFPADEVPAAGSEEDDEEESTAGLVSEVLAVGTLIEVFFALVLVAAVFVAVLYTGRHYLTGLREDLHETDILDAGPTLSSEAGSASGTLGPHGARAVLQRASFRFLDEEPPVESVLLDRHVEALSESPSYQQALREFRSGNYGRAASSWREILEGSPEGGATVRLGTVCRPQELRDTVDRIGSGFMILSGRSEPPGCFFLLWGLFPDTGAAEAALEGEIDLPTEAGPLRVAQLPELLEL